MVLMFGEFILSDNLFLKSFKNFWIRGLLILNFFQKARVIRLKKNQINNYLILILILKFD